MMHPVIMTELAKYRTRSILKDVEKHRLVRLATAGRPSLFDHLLDMLTFLLCGISERIQERRAVHAKRTLGIIQK